MINNSLYQDMFTMISSAHYILIVTHTNPDADTLCCALALSNYMQSKRINHKVYNSSRELPNNLDFLPRFDKIVSQIPKSYDLVIYVDCADEKRVNIQLDHDAKIINIDHHQSNTNFADLNIINSKKGSTAEVLYQFFEINNITLTKDIATCLYVGIYDDNIAFTTPRTTADTFKVINKLVETGISPALIANKYLRRDSLAKYRIIPKILNTLELFNEGIIATIYLESIWLDETGARVQECDDVVNMILSMNIVQVVAYFRIIEGKVRVSLRSKGDIDVSEVAASFNGGGHKNAAGLTIEVEDLEVAKGKLLEIIKNHI